MSQKIQKEFEDLIQTLTTEISKKVLLEDLKKLGESFQKTREEYTVVIDQYTKELKKMRLDLTSFKEETVRAKEHTNEVKTLNNSQLKLISSMNTALSMVEKSKESVLRDILSDNEKLYKTYKTEVARLNVEEEGRLLKSIRNEFSSSENTLKDIHGSMISVMKKIDYNKEEALEAILKKNTLFADAYQENIAAFNEEQKKSFIAHFEKHILTKMNKVEENIQTDFSAKMNEISLHHKKEKDNLERILLNQNEYHANDTVLYKVFIEGFDSNEKRITALQQELMRVYNYLIKISASFEASQSRNVKAAKEAISSQLKTDREHLEVSITDHYSKISKWMENVSSFMEAKQLSQKKLTLTLGIIVITLQLFQIFRS